MFQYAKRHTNIPIPGTTPYTPKQTGFPRKAFLQAKPLLGTYISTSHTAITKQQK